MKYKLTDETIEHNGRRLYRIQALKDFSNVKAGDLGGWVESEGNLNQEGNCWVFDEARISDNAWVFDDAQVFDIAWVHDTAQISGTTWITGRVWVGGRAEIKNGFVG
jgi:tetrahydrodipicolinate N-succinyltransferase